MLKPNNTLLGVVGLASLTIAALLAAMPNATAGNDSHPGPNVTVINGAARPVPVTGSISVDGDTSVLAEQSGAWNVGVNGTVNVAGTVSLSDDPVAVDVAPRGVVRLGHLDTAFNPGSIPRIIDIDMSNSTKLRLVGRGQDVMIQVDTVLTQLTSGRIDEIRMGEHVDSFTRFYEVPGERVHIRVWAPDGTGNITLSAFGN